MPAAPSPDSLHTSDLPQGDIRHLPSAVESDGVFLYGEEYQTLLEDCRKTGDYGRINTKMFQPFTKYENLTWQQVEIVLAVARAIK